MWQVTGCAPRTKLEFDWLTEAKQWGVYVRQNYRPLCVSNNTALKTLPFGFRMYKLICYKTYKLLLSGFAVRR